MPTSSGEPDGSDAAGAALAQLCAAIDALLAIDPTALSSARLVEVLTGVETQARRLPVVRHRLVAEVDARGVPAAHGVRSTAAFLRNLLGLGPGEAKGWVRNAEHLTERHGLSSGEATSSELPATAAAQAAGLLTDEHVRVITAAMHRLPTTLGLDDRAAAERAFVAAATEYDAKKLALTIERLLEHLDPDGTQDRHRQARRRRGVTIGLPGPDGLAKISGWLTPLVREAVLAVLDTFSAPNPLHPENVATPDDVDPDLRPEPAAQAQAPQPAHARSGANPEPSHERGGVRHEEQAAHAGHDDEDRQPDGAHPDRRSASGDEYREDRQSAALRQPAPGDPPLPARSPRSERSSNAQTAEPSPESTPSVNRTLRIGTQLRDLRSAGQRLHDALGEACERVLAAGTLPVHAGLPATRRMVARLADLRAGSGLATSGHGGTVPIADAVRLAARAHIVPMVFDSDSSPLWASRRRPPSVRR